MSKQESYYTHTTTFLTLWTVGMANDKWSNLSPTHHKVTCLTKHTVSLYTSMHSVLRERKWNSKLYEKNTGNQIVVSSFFFLFFSHTSVIHVWNGLGKMFKITILYALIILT